MLAGPAPESLRRRLITVSKSKKTDWAAASIQSRPLQAPKIQFAVRPQTHRGIPHGLASPVRVRLKTRSGHCRTSGRCAKLRTIEEASTTTKSVYNPGTHWADIPSSASKLNLPQLGDTKSPRGTMPHERGPSPVPPSEFICAALADPKARFCRSLASHSQRQRLLSPTA